MNKFINDLTLLRGLYKDEVFASACSLYLEDTAENQNDFLCAAYAADAENRILTYVQELILYDVNAYSLRCAKCGSAGEGLTKSFYTDLINIDRMIKSAIGRSGLSAGESNPLFDDNQLKTADNLAEFYKSYGYGEYAKYSVFIYRDEKILPVSNPDIKKFSQLKDYEEEKKLICNNICDFLNGYPYSHMLLYGDRGTGKSSTIHALPDRFADSKLRIIEVDKSCVKDIKKIREEVSTVPLKFLIFIDDLSVGEGDDVSSLKAAVEGTLVDGNNTLICVTSNRRHLINESFDERNNAVHPSDLAEEQLSLSDRFGLTVIFSSTDKQKYLSIVRQLADDLKLKTPTETLESLAERWAIAKGGRSPRRAEQFVNLVYSSERANRKIEF